MEVSPVKLMKNLTKTKKDLLAVFLDASLFISTFAVLSYPDTEYPKKGQRT